MKNILALNSVWRVQHTQGALALWSLPVVNTLKHDGIWNAEAGGF